MRRKNMRALFNGGPTAARRGSFRMALTPGAGGACDLYLYDFIDPWADEYWGGVSATMIVEALQLCQGAPVTLHINSPGGDVFEALAIYATLKNYPGAVTSRVEGLAASAASYIMLAANTVEIEPNGMIMIHEASGYEYGNAAELHAFADILDLTSDNIAAMYAAKAGTDVAGWRAAMRTETWYAGQKAVDAGLVDRVADAAPAGGETVMPAMPDTGGEAGMAGMAALWAGIYRPPETPAVDSQPGGGPPSPAPEPGLSNMDFESVLSGLRAWKGTLA